MRQGEHTSRTGSVVFFILFFLTCVCLCVCLVAAISQPDLPPPQYPIFRNRIPKNVGSLVKTSHTSIQLIHPYGQTSREVLQRVRTIRPKLSDWNIVIIISLSYITSFLQHKNRSITMITIFLNVNIQYLLHFQINLFLIYFVVIIFPPKTKQK